MRKLLLVPLIFAVCCQSLYSRQQSCTDAEVEADRLRTWDALYQFHRRFPHCDDGAVAEGYGESVARILVDHWETLPRLADLSMNDKIFQKFVISHIDTTLNMEDVKKIKTNAVHHCRAAQGDLCKQLRMAAERAMKEYTER